MAADISDDALARARALAAAAVERGDEIAPELYELLSPETVLALLEYVERLDVRLRELYAAAFDFEDDLSEYCDGPWRGTCWRALVTNAPSPPRPRRRDLP